MLQNSLVIITIFFPCFVFFPLLDFSWSNYRSNFKIAELNSEIDEQSSNCCAKILACKNLKWTKENTQKTSVVINAGITVALCSTVVGTGAAQILPAGSRNLGSCNSTVQ